MTTDPSLIIETPRQKWLRWLGNIFIPERHIGIVYQDGCFSRFLAPGYHSRLRFWDEQLMAISPISFHNTESTISIRSNDGFTFRAELSTRFSFNPSQAITKRQSMMAEIALRRERHTIVNRLMEREVESGAAFLGGEYSGEQLMTGSTRSQFEQRLKRHVKAVLTVSGLNLFEPSGLLLKSLEPPTGLAQLHLNHYTRTQAIQLLSKIAPELRPIDLLDQMIRQGKASFHMYDAHFSRTLQHYYAQVFAAPIPNQSAPYEAEYIINGNPSANRNTNGHSVDGVA